MEDERLMKTVDALSVEGRRRRGRLRRENCGKTDLVELEKPVKWDKQQKEKKGTYQGPVLPHPGLQRQREEQGPVLMSASPGASETKR